MSLISVSRRNDIPSCFGDWFLQKIKDGFCETQNPFNGLKQVVSLKPDDVDGFIFWSKNYIPFVEKLIFLEDKGYKFYLNYTLNNYSKILEPLYNQNSEIAANLINLSKKYTIFWRYDPIYISKKMDFDFHLKNFNFLCENFTGKVNRVIINFIQEYPKVIKRLDRLKDTDFEYIPLNNKEKLDLGLELKNIASNYGIDCYSCTPILYKNSITKKSHCVDKIVFEKLTNKILDLKESPNFSGCHCYKSIDIGFYKSCPNNCIYCYAN
ncbi:MAG: hypothetical protein A2086_07595 [Spirochaetes bacterium GWD1_27_9]|nr:MAG: hypothetical protein A2Z98_10485 [Spirochaetes bacterium GWB1_27_13]OHD26517.1 MAG: hypothetical protein A2Y34_12960 [Spirochaetes bacterium GWC1_27_15]OHD44794.1 MAG: hypothetical protein A2086_07595 [Spirochaetes bacterium GWD1_27_9]